MPETHRALRTLDSGDLSVATITRTYPTSAADLWDACTNAERLPRWFLPVTGDLAVGGRYQLEGNAGGTVERCDPPRSFAATWEFGGEVSWITVTITPDGDDARLVLEHTAPPNEHWRTYGPGATGVGWELGLRGLELHLASGAAVDPTEFEAWTAGPDGVAFVTAVSDAWGEAWIEAGTPAEQARTAAAATTAFYTGQEAPA